MVITKNIADYNVYHVLDDNGNSLDILFYDAFSRMAIPLEWLGKVDASITGFS